MTPYRDSSGLTLADYPRPSVAVDTAVLTVPIDDPLQLCVLLVRAESGHRAGWSLPGTFLHPGERLADAVLRSLDAKAGVLGLRPRQLSVFDRPDRDDRGWVLSVAHVDAVPYRRVEMALHGDRADLAPVDDLPRLPFDHREIVELAVDDLRGRYADAPDPAHLLRGPFTLLQLRRLHEAVAGRPLPKDTFRRHMEPRLRETGDLAAGVVGKPARLFRRPRTRGAHG